MPRPREIKESPVVSGPVIRPLTLAPTAEKEGVLRMLNTSACSQDQIMSAIDAQIAGHTGLAHRIANHYLPTALYDREDYYQLALIGLWKACQAYQPDKGPFASYAAQVMHNEIRMVLRKRTVPTEPWDDAREASLAAEEDVESAVWESALRVEWQGVLGQADSLTQEIVSQRLQGHSIRQTAQELVCSAGRVGHRLRKLRRMWMDARQNGDARGNGSVHRVRQ